MQKAYISFTSTLLIGFFFVIAYSRAFNESMMFKDGPCENLFMWNEMFWTHWLLAKRFIFAENGGRIHAIKMNICHFVCQYLFMLQSTALSVPHKYLYNIIVFVSALFGSRIQSYERWIYNYVHNIRKIQYTKGKCLKLRMQFCGNLLKFQCTTKCFVNYWSIWDWEIIDEKHFVYSQIEIPVCNKINSKTTWKHESVCRVEEQKITTLWYNLRKIWDKQNSLSCYVAKVCTVWTRIRMIFADNNEKKGQTKRMAKIQSVVFLPHKHPPKMECICCIKENWNKIYCCAFLLCSSFFEDSDRFPFA